MTYQSITVPGQLDSLTTIREFVKRASAEAGLTKQRAYRLMLAVDEIAANIVIHGYDEAGRQGDIEAGFDVDDERLRVHLFDRAIPYDPNQHSKPDHLNRPLEDRPIGGLGVYLAREGTDDFLYEFVDDRNHNIFVVNRIPTSTESTDNDAP
jgi:anti-sigma regulatory factor (Ser/Thr protein kinase)